MTPGPTVAFEFYSKMESLRERKAALAQESAYGKSVLWRQHLAWYESKMEMNQQQKDFIKRVSEFLDESFFATPTNSSEAEYLKSTRGKPFRDLMQNVKKKFTPKQSRQLFLTVGDTATITDWGCGPAKVEGSEASVDKAHGPNASEPASKAFSQCYCTDSLCGSGCGSNARCVGGNCASGGNCGCFGIFDCTGGCEQYPEIQ
jgi:hypothetical protein